MPEVTVPRSEWISYAKPPLSTLSIKSIKRRSYDPSNSRWGSMFPVPGPPGQAPNQHNLRRSSSSQLLYPSMLSVLDCEIQRPATTSPKPSSKRSSRSSYCEANTVNHSLASIKTSTLNMFDTVQAALVRAEKAELQAKANMMKWRTAVTELDRLRDENLLVRNRYENSEAECIRLRDILEQIQLSSPSESSIDVPPSLASSTTKKAYKLSKLSKKAR
ncbi:hypothetical protein Unana1_03483 [Umbelopsis nana]